MIDFNRDYRGKLREEVPTISSEGHGTKSFLGAESCDEFGQVVHVLKPEQLRQLQSHPAATIFPCRDVDIARMRKSLETVGQQQTITLYGSGQEIILDGNCRVQAAIKSNKPLTAVWIDDEALNGLSPEKWVFDRNRANEGGRRLNDTQLALVAVRAEIEIARREAESRKRNGAAPDEQKGEAYAHIAQAYELTPNSKENLCSTLESKMAQPDNLIIRLGYPALLRRPGATDALS